MEKQTVEEAEVVKPVFNPQANYTWKTDDTLKIKGAELHIVHNTLSSIFEGDIPLPKMFVMLAECFKVSSGILKRGVEDGIVKEQPKDADVTK